MTTPARRGGKQIGSRAGARREGAVSGQRVGKKEAAAPVGNEAGAPGTHRSVNMIVARSQNGAIGQSGRIPWRLRDDMRFFREMTTGNTVVMGRKTFESIGRPWPERRNVVVTRDKQFQPDGVDVVHSPEGALALPLGPDDGEIFVIGGQQIYEALLPHTDVVYLTQVDAVVDGDAFFPDLSDEWEMAELRRQEADDDNEFSFVIYVARRRR